MILTDDHILYHGATTVVRDPLTRVGRPELDFGPGFYLTNDRIQAENWALTKAGRKRGLKAILNVYHFDQEAFLADASYKTRIFPQYNVEWLDFTRRYSNGKTHQRGTQASGLHSQSGNHRQIPHLRRINRNMKDYQLYRKITRIVMQLSDELSISPKRALLLFYSTDTALQLQDPKYGLQLMSDTYLVNDIKTELALR